MSLRLTGTWHLAQPLDETAEGLGAGAPADAPPPDDGGSLSDHEASFAPGASRTEPEPDATPATGDRDNKTGQFKPRHRAVSQRASAADVPRIAELTKNWRTTEAERDAAKSEAAALKAERETLARERDELRARLEKPSAPAATEPQKPADKFAFPTYEKFLDTNPNASYDEWEIERLHAFGEWKDSRADINGRIRQTIDAERHARTVDETVASARERGRAAYPDFDEVMKSGPGATVPLGATDEQGGRRCLMIFTHPQSEHLQYAIMKDGELAKRLGALDDISFGMELATLVAQQRSTDRPPTRTAAAVTGSAPAPSRPPAPRPPNPVRTGSIAEPDTPPDPDDQSLSAHEKHYGQKYR